MARLAEADILLRLNEAADSAGIKLTYTHKLFFLRLINIADCKGGVYRTSLTVDEFSEAFSMPKRTVTECLSRLTACKAITRQPRTKPQFTRLNEKIFEEQEK